MFVKLPRGGILVLLRLFSGAHIRILKKFTQTYQNCSTTFVLFSFSTTWHFDKISMNLRPTAAVIVWFLLLYMLSSLTILVVPFQQHCCLIFRFDRPSINFCLFGTRLR